MIQQEKIGFLFPTMLSGLKCKNLYDCALEVRKVNGEFWDCGCHSGGSAAAMKLAAPEKPIRLFDSFEGLPPSSVQDLNNEPGRFAIPFDENLWVLGPVHAGWIPETFKGLEESKISLAHIDLDLYQGTKDALEFIAPRIVPGGFIVIDDYGSTGWSGVTKAVNELSNDDFVVAKRVAEQITLKRRIE
jgi:O-methyltransferase